MDFELQHINWGEEIAKLQDRKKELLNHKASLENQIAAIDRAIESLVFLGNPHAAMPLDHREITDMGVQDAVRAIFRRSYPMSLMPTEIKNFFLSAGLYRPNLLIEIHNAISRMGEDLEETKKGGKKAYRWNMRRKSEPGDIVGDHADPSKDDPTIRQKK